MNIGIIRDARNQINYGARTVTPTLSKLMRDIANNVLHIQVPLNLVIGTILPNKFSYKIWQRRSVIPFQGYILFEKLLGAKFGLLENELDPMAASELIIKYSRRNDLLYNICETIKKTDLVVIDANGDFVLKEKRFGMTSGLALLEIAKKFKKKIAILNTMISDPSNGKRDKEMVEYLINTAEKCDLIVLRDYESVNVLNELVKDVNTAMIPDLLFYRFNDFSCEAIMNNLPNNGNYLLPANESDDKYFDKLNFDCDYICITGGAQITKRSRNAVESYCYLVNILKDIDIPIYLIPTCSGDKFLYQVSDKAGVPIIPSNIPAFAGGLILANAKLFISARYHPSILASFGGTPTIFIEADSHKMSSLQPLLGYPDIRLFSAPPSEAECEEIYKLAKTYLSDYEIMSRSIKDAAKKRYEETFKYHKLITELMS